MEIQRFQCPEDSVIGKSTQLYYGNDEKKQSIFDDLGAFISVDYCEELPFVVGI